MTDNRRTQTIESWHIRADAYEILVKNHRIFTDMIMNLVEFVGKNRRIDEKDLHIMDLAAGTGLVSKLLIEHLHISPSCLYLVEPAENMCQHAREDIQTSHIYQIDAENCLNQTDLPRNYFDFILCNASMHLMSENDIYPIVAQLLKPKQGYFLYTLWYHAFDETQCFDHDEEFEKCVNDAMMEFNYPKYFTGTNQLTQGRSRKYLEAIAERNGLELQSCRISMHRIPLSFNLDFKLMSTNWLIDHLKTQCEDVYAIKERIVARIRELINDKYTEKPVVEIILSRLS